MCVSVCVCVCGMYRYLHMVIASLQDSQPSLVQLVGVLAEEGGKNSFKMQLSM